MSRFDFTAMFARLRAFMFTGMLEKLYALKPERLPKPQAPKSKQTKDPEPESSGL